jgi:hypothetical protein
LTLITGAAAQAHLHRRWDARISRLYDCHIFKHADGAVAGDTRLHFVPCKKSALALQPKKRGVGVAFATGRGIL